MRLTLTALMALAACSQEANHLGNPLLWPVNAISSTVQNGVYDDRRGQVEIQVKSAFPEILSDIENGGGPDLTHAMDLAGVPVSDRPARLLQLKADLPLYVTSPSALIVALMVYGS